MCFKNLVYLDILILKYRQVVHLIANFSFLRKYLDLYQQNFSATSVPYYVALQKHIL